MHSVSPEALRGPQLLHDDLCEYPATYDVTRICDTRVTMSSANHEILTLLRRLLADYDLRLQKEAIGCELHRSAMCDVIDDITATNDSYHIYQRLLRSLRYIVYEHKMTE